MAWVEVPPRTNTARSEEDEGVMMPARSWPLTPRPFTKASRPVSVDVDEQSLARSAPRLLDLLLSDMTTGNNIIWATDDYVHLGSGFAGSQPVTADSITGANAGLIRPRVEKSKEKRGDRARTKAEVFTPTWLCNEQNNLVDEAWFGRKGVFNTSIHRGWRRTVAPIDFEAVGERTWHHYVDEQRLEAACGEAPYLVSRYDATSGEPVALERRIGLLDRKMRVVTERCREEVEWLRWAQRAFESVYGFEFHGDSLLLARENMLASYIDYVHRALRRQPTERELITIAEIIAWNVWQMDALTGTIPFKTIRSGGGAPALFELDEDNGPACRVRDWRANETVEFRFMRKGDRAR